MSELRLSADEARHRLYEIMKGAESFEEKATEALELGVAYLDVETGFVTRIETETDHWETIVSTDGTSGLVPEGMETNLSGTYCRHTLERDSPLALHDVPEQGYETGADGFDCYHGTTLTIDGEPYGTVCFVARDARTEPFSEAETMFAELVSRLLEHELEYERKHEQLERQTSLVNVLDRVLRHNIRNKMTVVRANARLHSQQHDDCTECDQIVAAANELIEMSETARQLGKTINADFERKPTDLRKLVAQLESDLRNNYPAANLTVDVPDNLILPAFPNLETALWELVENSAKHSGDQPQIRISARETDDTVEIEIADDGPGMPEAERDVLHTGTETKLVHGSGLGLWSVYWVATGHRGSIDIDTDDGTRVTLTLPRFETETANQEQIPRVGDRYEAVFEHSPVGLMLLDSDANVIDANGQAGALIGPPTDAITGRPFDEVLGRVTGPLADRPIADGSGQCSTTDGETLEYAVRTNILPGQDLIVIP